MLFPFNALRSCWRTESLKDKNPQVFVLGGSDECGRSEVPLYFQRERKWLQSHILNLSQTCQIYGMWTEIRKTMLGLTYLLWSLAGNCKSKCFSLASVSNFYLIKAGWAGDMVENQRMKIHSKEKHDREHLYLTSLNKEKKQDGWAKRTEVFRGHSDHVNWEMLP